MTDKRLEAELERLREAVRRYGQAWIDEQGDPVAIRTARIALFAILNETLMTLGGTPCPICGRSDGRHDPTPEERAHLRRVKWRAFWNGFFGFFYPPLLKGPHLFTKAFWK